MTLDELLNEAKALKRETLLLKPNGSGDVVAKWYEINDDELERTNHICWLSVDSNFIPGVSLNEGQRFLTIFSNEEDCESGKVELSASFPARDGMDLYAEQVDILPPIDALIAKGGGKIGDWLESNNWKRNERYHSGFGDHELVKQYLDLEYSQNPITRNDGSYAVLGGWHEPGPDDDWHDLLEYSLCVLTLENSEPWIETWFKSNNEFQVIQRTT
ncbi:hypothetical protein OAG71_00495 [bacterium]|nr:hypothetical protein [bacterium]